MRNFAISSVLPSVFCGICCVCSGTCKSWHCLEQEAARRTSTLPCRLSRIHDVHAHTRTHTHTPEGALRMGGVLQILKLCRPPRQFCHEWQSMHMNRHLSQVLASTVVSVTPLIGRIRPRWRLLAQPVAHRLPALRCMCRVTPNSEPMQIVCDTFLVAVHVAAVSHGCSEGGGGLVGKVPPSI
jgi:hypothetical protein